MSTSTAPIVIDLGKVKPKRIRQLKRGQGKLVNEINEVVNEVRSQLGEEVQDKVLVPVVLTYCKKTKTKNRRPGFLFPF